MVTKAKTAALKTSTATVSSATDTTPAPKATEVQHSALYYKMADLGRRDYEGTLSRFDACLSYQDMVRTKAIVPSDDTAVDAARGWDIGRVMASKDAIARGVSATELKPSADRSLASLISSFKGFALPAAVEHGPALYKAAQAAIATVDKKKRDKYTTNAFQIADKLNVKLGKSEISADADADTLLEAIAKSGSKKTADAFEKQIRALIAAAISARVWNNKAGKSKIDAAKAFIAAIPATK